MTIRTGNKRMSGLMRSAIAAVIGGAVAAAIWAGITYGTGMEIGWIAWGVGFVVGLAVRIASGDSYDGVAPGLIAVVGAILALVVGKYAAIHLLVDQEMGDMTYEVTADDRLVAAASDVAATWAADGKKLKWPANMNAEDAAVLTDYPLKVVAEARKIWEAKSAEEQAAEIAKEQAAGDEMVGEFREMLKMAAFKESFSPIDLLFFGLAVFTAFKLGSGMTGD
ncbi:MAG: hypothetical protein ABJZ55_17515 [Fuerstiella sp.]